LCGVWVGGTGSGHIRKAGWPILFQLSLLAVPELRLPHPFGFPFDYAQGFGKTGQALAFFARVGISNLAC
jgi:hypothetical protein